MMSIVDNNSLKEIAEQVEIRLKQSVDAARRE